MLIGGCGRSESDLSGSASALLIVVCVVGAILAAWGVVAAVGWLILSIIN